jgi:hypothetical protein
VRAIYRVRQGLQNLSARVEPESVGLANEYLSPAERQLFARMEPADQRHSVGVLRSLLSMGIEDATLLKAALLHDVGKSRCRIGVVHRTVAVLLTAIFGELPSFAWQRNTGFWMPFYVLENHPRIGAVMLARAGSEERVWRLTELHQLEPELVGRVNDNEWVRWALALLRKADNKN